MKPVLTPAEATELDRATQEHGITGETLMDRAGRAVARAAIELAGGVYGRRCVVVCGPGNNGGDGRVAARELQRRGMRAAAFAPGEEGLARELARADVVIDAIFGTGFRGAADGDAAEAIAAVNASGLPVVAVDIPSGVDGTTGAVRGEAIRAALTVTFGAPKTGVILLPGAGFAGTVRVVDIGFPDDLLPPEETGVCLIEPSDVRAVLPARPPATHKRASGVLAVVAGSRDMAGAARFVATAAARVGTGLVVVCGPESVVPVLQQGVPQAVFHRLPETAGGTVAAAALDPLSKVLERADALALGPGLGTDEETTTLVRSLVAASPVPVVLDADGLNAFAGRAAEFTGAAAPLVLTPHEGEFVRLAGGDVAGLEEAGRIAPVRALAATTRATVLLKGSRTIVASPGDDAAEGPVRIVLSGGPVLATAGTGDVLTGAIGGLLARGLDPTTAAWAGAYLHGVAGHLAGREAGEGTLAGEVADHLPAAIAEVSDG